jgi:hypothetical protein
MHRKSQCPTAFCRRDLRSGVAERRPIASLPVKQDGPGVHRQAHPEDAWPNRRVALPDLDRLMRHAGMGC